MAATVNAKFEQISGVTSSATVRSHRLIVDRGVAKGGADQGPAGGEYLLVGLGGCFTSHLLAAIATRSADVRDVIVTAHGTMDGTPERFTAFVVEVTAKAGDDELGRKMVLIAARGCQVVNTLKHSTSIAFSYNGSPVDVDAASPHVPD